MTWSIDEIADLSGDIHSGVRKDDRYMFLVDSHNFYKIDTLSNEVGTLPD